MAQLWRRISKLGSIAWRGGLRDAISTSRNFLLTRENRQIEKRYGVDIQSFEFLEEMSIVGAHQAQGFYYGPSAAPVIRLLLNQLDDDLQKFTFIDYGSGKGLPLLIASLYPFQKVIGVEFASQLHDVARSNIQRFDTPDRRCKSVHSLLMDAAEFHLPETDCVLFFCNPFTESVMQRVLENIEIAYRQRSQKIYVLFYQLFREDAESTADTGALLDASPWLQRKSLRRQSLLKSWLLNHIDMRIYESNPS